MGQTAVIDSIHHNSLQVKVSTCTHTQLTHLLGITYKSTVVLLSLLYISLAIAIQGVFGWHALLFGKSGLDYLPVTYNRWGCAVA